MVYGENSWKAAMIQAGLDQPEAQFGCPIAYSYCDQDIENLLRIDFEDIKIVTDHIFPYKIDEYKQGQYVKHPWFEAMPTELFAALKKQFGWHKLVSAKKIETQRITNELEKH